jgi:hypothetical protein
MATQQPQQQSMMPLQGEMQLVNYLSSLFGGKTVNPNYTGETVLPPSLIPEMTGDDMSSVMTEWLRGQGNFLGNQRQQNLAGLYNTSTSKLVANDLTAQAALKAALANTQIKQGNSQLQNQYYSRLQNQQPQYLPQDPNQMGKVGAALGVSALNSLLGGGGKDGGGLLDKLMGALTGTSAKTSTQPSTGKKPATKKPTDVTDQGQGADSMGSGTDMVGGIDPIEAALNDYYGVADPMIAELTADAVNPNFNTNYQNQLLGDFAAPSGDFAFANPMQGFSDNAFNLPADTFAPIDTSQVGGFNPSDFSYLTGGNDGADFGFDGTFDSWGGGGEITFENYEPFVPDTSASFQDSYGGGTGYDFFDYGDYEFDW